MFARAFQHVKVGGAFATAAAIGLVAGTACKDPINCTCALDVYTAVARGANVVPVTTDTAPRASVSVVPLSFEYTYSYSLAVAPPGTIDSIAIYEVGAGDTLPASAIAILCAGGVACARTSGNGTVVAPATVATITAAMRAFTAQVVFFTTTAQKAAGGAMRGTMYLDPNP